jgi:tetratricopeptide (TPR) repeat protein
VNLLLSAVDVVGPLRWRWELRDEATGEVIAEHHVSLDDPVDSSQVDAFGDLHAYVRWHADPLWRDDEQRIITETGTWARDAVLGVAITAAIVAAAPATVLVSVPAPADGALLWPLELAFADGAPLAARGDVSFVYCVGNSTPVPDDPVRPLRILAAFPKPTGTGITAQRRKRHGLAELIAAIASRDEAAIELQVLQYGVTRQRLSEAIAAGGGWDVVHLAGHGGRGRFLLDQPDGSIDRVSTADLAGLLRPTRGRLKLAVLASCESATEAAPDTLRLLGLPAKKAEPAATHASRPVSGLAKGLAAELGCAVVATRYVVTDEFSIAFDHVFYDRLLSRGEPVAVASASALATVLAAASAGESIPGGGPAVAVPGILAPADICAATLGVFGASAVTVTLRAAPADRGRAKVAGQAGGRMADFPDQPARFVGRDALMTTLSTALRPGGGSTAVLLQGMPGIGKTACALELAYLCQDQFSAVAFWRPPTESDPDLILRSLADALHKQLGQSGARFAPPPRWGRRRWSTYARRLRDDMRASRVLVAVDNLEELLLPDGSWREPRWGAIFDALAAHDGGSRLVATSRFAPASFAQPPAEGCLRLPVGPLSWAEAVTSVWEVPALRTLMFDGRSPALSPLSRVGTGWRQVREALERVQGHPGLLELADAAVSEQAGPLAQAERERTERAIGEWAAAAASALPSDAKLMAWFIAGLEPRDRRLTVIDGTWPGLWRRLGRPGAPPSPGPLVDTLVDVMLTGRDDQQARPLDPVVAAAMRREIPADVRAAADVELAAYWRGDGEVGGRAGAALAALPYLVRRRDYGSAAALLGDALLRGALPAGSEDSYLPELRQVARSTAAPAAGAALALVTQSDDQAAARQLLEDSLASAESAGDYPLAWVIAGHLADTLRGTGHLDQALDVLARQERYAQAADLGPWTKLAGHSRRLIVLAWTGRKEQVLVEIADARDRMRRLAEAATNGELPCVRPWTVREEILGTGRDCAVEFRRWPEALELGAEIQDSQRQRRASGPELARTRLFDAYPLVQLGRLTEAAGVLVECQQVFENNGDTSYLSQVFIGRANLEATLGHADAAVRLARSALRMTYTRTLPELIADAHKALAHYLRKAGGPTEEQQAHWLAAALVYRLGGEDRALDKLMVAPPRGLRVGRDPRRQSGIAGPPPRTLAELIDAAEQTSGVHLAELLTAIEPDAGTVTCALTEILDSAAGQGPAAASRRAQGASLFESLGGYELASNPDVVSLVNRFRGWLGSQANRKNRPEEG